MEKQYLIVCGKLYDGLKDELQAGMEILVEGNKIKEVGKNLSRPAGVEVIDLSHLTVTPGLIDAHVHGYLMRWQDFLAGGSNYKSENYSTLANLHTCQRSMERGFTTIRLHGGGYLLADVKRVIDGGFFPGSRVRVCFNMMGSPGGHADQSAAFSTNPALSDLAETLIPTLGSGADFFRHKVRKEVKYGTDFVKLFIGGGFASPNDGPEDQQLCDEEIEAVISTARGLYKPTTAHVYNPPLMQKLMHYGITGMEHGSLMDEETAKMFEDTNTYLVPTFCPYNEVINFNEENLKKKDPWFQAKLRKYAQWLQDGRKIIANSKIRLGYGTDFVTVHQCYESWYEWQSWFRAGIDPFRILKAATMENARILEMESLVGSIEPGKFADIAGWHRDLMTDEDALSECDFVMKDGVVYPTSNRINE